jgi:hypothetical protein
MGQAPYQQWSSECSIIYPITKPAHWIYHSREFTGNTDELILYWETLYFTYSVTQYCRSKHECDVVTS